MIEYQCMDCGYSVFNPVMDAPPDPPRCATCDFIAQAPEPHQAGLRAHLFRDLEPIQPVAVSPSIDQDGDGRMQIWTAKPKPGNV